MTKMFLLFSHKLTKEQIEDAYESLGVTEFISLPQELQHIWSNVSAELEEISEFLKPIENYLNQLVHEGDVVLVQGDFGATCHMSFYAKSLGAVAVYATTKRDVVEQEIDGKIVKTSVFKHVRFRKY